MNRDEAAKFLHQLAKWLTNSQLGASYWPDQLDEVTALLSSPCACRDESLAEGAGEVYMRGDRGYVAPHIKLYASDGFKDGQIVTAYILDLPGGKHE